MKLLSLWAKINLDSSFFRSFMIPAWSKATLEHSFESRSLQAYVQVFDAPDVSIFFLADCCNTSLFDGVTLHRPVNLAK